MTTPELPPLPAGPKPYRIEGCWYVDAQYFRDRDDVCAEREHILLARIEELEADAARLDSGRIMFTTRDVYGEPARVTFAGVDLRAAIDAAREAKL